MAKRLLHLILILGYPAHGATLLVGPDMPFENPSQAAKFAEDGDTIEIEAAKYVGDVAVWTQDNLVIRGIGGRPHMIANGNAAEGKAIWVIKGNNTVVENVEFSGATVEDENGAGIRQEGTDLIIRNCYFHDNENGVLTGANPDSEILIEHSVFSNNGYGDGYSHNMYIGRVAKFTLQFSYAHHARVGHQVKSRAVENFIMFNRLMDEQTGTSSYLVDLPDPGKAYVVGNEIQQGPLAENWAMVHSAQELTFLNNTVVNDRHSGVFVVLSTDGKSSVLQNNIFAGNGTLDARGATLTSNLIADDVGLVDRQGFDYRLTSGSPAINAGTSLGQVADVQWEYEHAAGTRSRLDDPPIDIGAHAFSLPPE